MKGMDMKQFLIIAVLAASMVAAFGQGHPFLFMTPADVARVQDNATSSVAFAELAQTQIARAQQVDVNQLPSFETDWWAEEEPKPYTARDRAVTLEHMRLVPLQYGTAAKDCARAWILTGETNYLGKAKAVLLKHSEYDFGFSDVNCGLDYTVASLGAMEAYDIAYDHFTSQERDTMDDFFMRLVAAVELNDDYWVAYNPSGTEMNNHEGWHRACMAMVGFFYDDQYYIDKAITDSKGFYDMLQDGFLDEGLWGEASLPYQYVQLEAMLFVADLARNAGYSTDLYTHVVDGRSLRGCFDSAAFGLTFPDGLLPPIGDGYGSLHYPGSYNYYERLYTRLGDSKYAWLIDRSDNRDRDSLFWGVADLPVGGAPPVTSMLWPEHGYAALRTDEGTNYWAGAGWTLFSSFHSTCSHEHADKLSIMLYAKDHLWLRDSEARTAQAEKSNADITVNLNRATASHNTVMIDLEDQKTALYAPLDLLEFSTAPGNRRITVGDSGDRLYPGVRQLRTCIVRDDYVVDVFQVKADEAHNIAWTTHIDGEVYDCFDSVFGSANLSTNGPWQYIQADDVSTPTNIFWETFSHSGKFFRMDVASSQTAQYTRCRYPLLDTDPSQNIPMRMVGCQAAEATFVAVYRTGDAAITAPVEIKIGEASGESWLLGVVCQGATNEFAIRDLTSPAPSLPSEPYTDDVLTHVLLHCDELGSTGPVQTPDNDSANPGRDNDGLMIPEFYPPGTYSGATLGDSFDAAFGNALYFNGINQSIRVGDSTTDDLGIPDTDVRIEAYARLDHVKSNDDSLYTVFYQPARFSLVLTDRSSGDWRYDFAVWTELGLQTIIGVIADPENWHHYAIEFREGQFEAFIDGFSVGTVTNAGAGLEPAIRQLHIGGNHVSTRWWEGPIDEFRVSTLAEDSALTHVLLHCDELGSTGPIQTPDDDSANPGRDNDGTILPASYPPEVYAGAVLANSFDTTFGNAFYFNGIDQSIRVGDSTTDDLGVPDNNVRVEAYARLDHVKANDDSLYTVFYQAERFAVAITDRSLGDWRLDFTVWTDQGLKQVSIVIDDPEDWHQYAMEFGDGQLEAFVDGFSVGLIDDAGSALEAAVRHLYIGGTHVGNRWWEGPIDEFRASTLPLESPYSSWMEQYPGVGSQTDMLDDPDSDGHNNLHEWAFGGNPAYTGDLGYVPTLGTVEYMGGEWLEYIYAKRNDADALGLEYYLQQNDALTSSIAWTNAHCEFSVGNLDSAGPGFCSVTNWVNTADGDAQFLRLMLEVN